VEAAYWRALDEARSPPTERRDCVGWSPDLERQYPSATACLAENLPSLCMHLSYPLRLRKRLRLDGPAGAVRVPSRLTTLIEAKSLFNGGTGVVVFGIALALLSGYGTFSAGTAALQFFRMSVGGVGLGLLAGLGLSPVCAASTIPRWVSLLTVLAPTAATCWPRRWVCPASWRLSAPGS